MADPSVGLAVACPAFLEPLALNATTLTTLGFELRKLVDTLVIEDRLAAFQVTVRKDLACQVLAFPVDRKGLQLEGMLEPFQAFVE